MRGREAAATPSVSSLPKHSRSEKQIPPRERERLGTRERTTLSLCSTAVNSYVAMFRGHSSMKGCGFSFYFLFYIPFLWIFLYAVDAFFLLQFQTTWSYMEILHRQNCFAALQGPGAGAQALPPGLRCTEWKLH